MDKETARLFEKHLKNWHNATVVIPSVEQEIECGGRRLACGPIVTDISKRLRDLEQETKEHLVEFHNVRISEPSIEQKLETVFEIGKYYEHSAGEKLSMVALAETRMYGTGLIAENRSGDLRAVGLDETNAVNWHEITKEQWDEEDSVIEDKSIEQELEEGIKCLHIRMLQKPTRISLPAAKYEEVRRLGTFRYNSNGDLTFHDIPVFSYLGDKIIYCTD